jgi:hypothetical protein
MAIFSVQMDLEKETKNTIRYQERAQGGQPPRIGTLYIQKWALQEKPPKSIQVTVEPILI